MSSLAHDFHFRALALLPKPGLTFPQNIINANYTNRSGELISFIIQYLKNTNHQLL